MECAIEPNVLSTLCLLVAVGVQGLLSAPPAMRCYGRQVGVTQVFASSAARGQRGGGERRRGPPEHHMTAVLPRVNGGRRLEVEPMGTLAPLLVLAVLQ